MFRVIVTRLSDDNPLLALSRVLDALGWGRGWAGVCGFAGEQAGGGLCLCLCRCRCLCAHACARVVGWLRRRVAAYVCARVWARGCESVVDRRVGGDIGVAIECDS